MSEESMKAPNKVGGSVVRRKTGDSAPSSGIVMYKTPRGDSVVVVNKDVYDRAREAAKKKAS